MQCEKASRSAAKKKAAAAQSMPLHMLAAPSASALICQRKRRAARKTQKPQRKQRWRRIEPQYCQWRKASAVGESVAAMAVAGGKAGVMAVSRLS